MLWAAALSAPPVQTALPARPVPACPCLQVSRILFEKLQLPPPPVAKDLKSGGFSTGQGVGWERTAQG